tara:strand:+ start:398 stop:565 length:168 start_codon:yes stop_codon:yes gene_type:complete
MAYKNQLKIWNGKEFPRDFWNYYVNPITGFSTTEKGIEEPKEIYKYYKESQKGEL